MKTAVPLAPATISEYEGVRYLHLDSIWVQGAMRLARPATIELDYVQRMMAWLLLQEPAGLGRRHAVQFGLGAGAITRFCHGRLRMRTTAVEINPTVIAANRQWFRLPADGPRLAVVQADAGAWASAPERAGTVDVLCIDLYDHEAAGPVLDSEAFYGDVHRLLTPGGAVSVNVFGRHASAALSLERLQRRFGADRVRSLQPTREGNTVLLALKDADWPDRETLARRAAAHEARSGLPCRKWLRMIRSGPSAEPRDDSPPTPAD